MPPEKAARSNGSAKILTRAVRASSGVRVSHVEITGLVGGSAVDSGVRTPGGAAIGVWLADTESTELNDVQVQASSGGLGGYYSGGGGGGGDGGRAEGIWVEGGADVRIDDARVAGLVGRDGRMNYGGGGAARGLFLDGTTGARVAGLRVDDVVGGAGHGEGPDAAGEGLRLVDAPGAFVERALIRLAMMRGA